MLLTITIQVGKARRYVLEQDGVRTHMLNDASLEWHLKNKLNLNQDQVGEVFIEVWDFGVAKLELVPTEQKSA